MLPKSRRIKKQKEFDKIYKTQKVLFSPHFRLNFAFFKSNSKTSSQNSKFAIVTSKKVGKAFQRNRLRRILFPVIKEHELFQNSNIKLIIHCKPNCQNIFQKTSKKQIKQKHTKPQFSITSKLKEKKLKNELVDILNQIKY